MKIYKREIGEDLRLTKGALTSLFLSGLTKFDLSPILCSVGGGDFGFCKAWSIILGIPFSGNCEAFYENCDFDIAENAGELHKIVMAIIERDAPPPKDDEPKKAKRKRS